VWRRLERFLGLNRAPLPALVPRANASGGTAEAVPVQVLQSLRQHLLPTYALMARFYGIGWP
jgi:hypothetical protein